MKNFRGGGFGGRRNDRGFGGRNSDRRRGGGRDFDRPKYEAVCDECGRNCQVPFEPSGDKPIYCDDCFRNNKPNSGRDRGFGGRERSSGGSMGNNDKVLEKIEALNGKLERILKLLVPAPMTVSPKTLKEEESGFEEDESPKKKPKKLKKTEEIKKAEKPKKKEKKDSKKPAAKKKK